MMDLGKPRYFIAIGLNSDKNNKFPKPKAASLKAVNRPEDGRIEFDEHSDEQ